MSCYCDVSLENYDTRLQELFVKAAFDAVHDTNMRGLRDHMARNSHKLKGPISVKFQREWPKNDPSPEDVVQHILHSSLFSMCIDFGCKRFFHIFNY